MLSDSRMGRAFALGWQHGKKTRRASSPREVYQRHPHFNWRQVNAYLNGEEDGIQGDTFRLRLDKALERRRASGAPKKHFFR